ncbi:MAG: dephospho-CoA kinase [Chloroflexota bacterium]
MSKKSIVVGLTGNIATGKSTILAYLTGKGAYVIDADKLSHKSMTPDGPAYPNIVGHFGETILNDDRTINRPALGKIVFSDPTELKQLESFIHPAVVEMAAQEIANTEAKVVILEAIKLLDGGRTITLCDKIWVITAHPDIQLHRLIHDRGMDATEAQQRMDVQSSQAEKAAKADVVITNNGTPQELHQQLDALWDKLQEEFAG